MVKYLVSGVAGFLGSHFVESLVDDGHTVIGIDNLSSGQKSNVEHLLNNDLFQLMEQDVRLATSLPPVDRIVHLASRASPTDFTSHPVEIALTNTKGTRLLLDHARACDARFLYASTSEVYGDPEEHPQSEEYNGNVNIRGSRGCYDESKRFGETLVEAYIRKYGVDARTVRIFNTYGPRMRPSDGRVVPTFVAQALQNQDITVYGDGEQTRSFCYVDDMIAGLRAVLDAADPTYDVYNVGNCNELSINELAELIIYITETDSVITYDPLPEDDPCRRQPDISRIQADLGWKPSISLKMGLNETIDYFQRRLTHV